MNIDKYFELYIKNRIKYDRLYHIKNMFNNNYSNISSNLIKQIFNYIDKVIFGGKLYEYIQQHSIKLKFKVSSSLTSTAGMFYRCSNNKGNVIECGFKISSVFFNEIFNKNILNMDLGVVDQNNKKYLSTTTIEPLIVVMEHEIIHMLMWITRNNKLNDSNTVKSGHTKIFKKLVYNIFGHYKISHSLVFGDINANEDIKNKLTLGMYVIIITKKATMNGYIVELSKKYAIICTIDENNNKYNYTAVSYKDVDISNQNINKNIDVYDKLAKLKPGNKFIYRKKIYTINMVNNRTINASDEDNKIWKIPKYLILEFVLI